MASISQSHYSLDGSRPYRGSTHARERLSMPPTAQPPTSSPCVRPGCRHPERGFKLLSTKSKHLAHHSWLGACFRTSEVSEGERRYLWKRNSPGDKFVLIPASSTRRHYKNSWWQYSKLVKTPSRRSEISRNRKQRLWGWGKLCRSGRMSLPEKVIDLHNRKPVEAIILQIVWLLSTKIFGVSWDYQLLLNVLLGSLATVFISSSFFPG